MKKNLTEMVFILDRSGSMAGMEDDTIGGFNGLIKKQQKEEGEAFVSTVLFDDRTEVLHDRVALDKLQPMTDREYYVRGCTALLDAVGRAIKHISNVHKYAREEDRPEKTMMVIITDGYENASREYTYAKVKKLIHEQEEKHGWEFLFLGANIDAAAEADRFGICKERAVRYEQDSAGIAKNFAAVGMAMSCCRANMDLCDDWADEIKEYYEKKESQRKGKK